MRNKIKLLSLLFIGASILVSCESDKESEEYCQNPELICPEETDEIDANACCTDQNCYWTYNGNEYECHGTDCSDAQNAIISDACGTAALLKSSSKDIEQLKAEMTMVTENLLAEARAAAGCN